MWFCIYNGVVFAYISLIQNCVYAFPHLFPGFHPICHSATLNAGLWSRYEQNHLNAAKLHSGWEFCVVNRWFKRLMSQLGQFENVSTWWFGYSALVTVLWKCGYRWLVVYWFRLLQWVRQKAKDFNFIFRKCWIIQNQRF